jgi:hypothetical protein
MYTGIMISAVAVTGVLCIYQLVKWKTIKRNASLSPGEAGSYSTTGEPVKEVAWWTQLDTAIQLELALLLARKALPAWQKYCEGNELLYRNSPTGSQVRIHPALLKNSLEEISHHTDPVFPANTKTIIQWHNQFVAPLLALQDGNWIVAYPVKKIFLAVYNILRAITEQVIMMMTKNLLCLSINQSLDCLDMCRLYSTEEIKSFLSSYRTQDNGIVS